MHAVTKHAERLYRWLQALVISAALAAAVVGVVFATLGTPSYSTADSATTVVPELSNPAPIMLLALAPAAGAAWGAVTGNHRATWGSTGVLLAMGVGLVTWGGRYLVPIGLALVLFQGLLEGIDRVLSSGELPVHESADAG